MAVCCWDAICINFSFQYLLCFLQREEFQSTLNVVVSNVV